VEDEVEVDDEAEVESDDEVTVEEVEADEVTVEAEEETRELEELVDGEGEIAAQTRLNREGPVSCLRPNTC